MREDKYRCSPLVDDVAPHIVPLSAIVVLETQTDFELEQLRGADAATAAIQGTLYRPMFLDLMAAWTDQWSLAATIVARTPVYRLSRPRDLNRVEASADLALGLL